MMELKKTQQVATPSTQPKEEALKDSKFFDFLVNIKAELKKISWTDPEELKVYTKVVVATTFFLGMGIYFVDLIIQNVLNGLHFLFRVMGG